MKIISFIYKRTVIKKILIHLNVYEERKNQRGPPQIIKENTRPVVERVVSYDDGMIMAWNCLVGLRKRKNNGKDGKKKISCSVLVKLEKYLLESYAGLTNQLLIIHLI